MLLYFDISYCELGCISFEWFEYVKMVPKARKNISQVKKKRSGVLLATKLSIIHDLENGISVQDIMRKYQITSRSTVYGIQKSKVQIMANVVNIQGSIGK